MALERFTKDHEYVRLDGDVATIGITTHAQGQLGDIVFVELPEIGRKVSTGEAIAVVESVKAASDVFAPITGEVIAVNSALPDQPGLVNEDAEGKAWFFKLRITSQAEVEALLDRAAYDAFVAEHT
jgi:glycine cleavage system H protein